MDRSGRRTESPSAPDIGSSFDAAWIETLDRLTEICTKPPVVIGRPCAAARSIGDGCTASIPRTTAVLRARLQQVFEHCTALGLEPNWLHRLVIIDADTTDISAHDADALMVELTELVQRRFDRGEIITRSAGRIFVVADDSNALDRHLVAILAEARRRSLLQSARIFCWLEDLPAHASQIDRYLADLSA